MMNQSTRLDKFNKKKSFNDPVERDRVLMVYGGIFKHNIAEYAEKGVKKNSPEKNLSR